MPSLSRRSAILAACAAVIAAVVAVAAFAPLPVSIVLPGTSADVLGANEGTQVITISGTPVRATTGQLRMVTVSSHSEPGVTPFLHTSGRPSWSYAVCSAAQLTLIAPVKRPGYGTAGGPAVAVRGC
jgi:lipoprotein-anchoring transpeptidase ErfK/SrfK